MDNILFIRNKEGQDIMLRLDNIQAVSPYTYPDGNEVKVSSTTCLVVLSTDKSSLLVPTSSNEIAAAVKKLAGEQKGKA